ncbi:hypothetical protein AWB80_08175 [Caballeronia pedi]|uniref:Uncharacterized protein n=1 Tax=Caballeronia pedi TaxID=1777141 RepID=A0A158E4D8_9BURK|nr:hypothetical protein [Caballeronia pedi]SAL01643.1 hypothetical protein AWB80_08175 [Caballeronia pedi]
MSNSRQSISLPLPKSSSDDRAARLKNLDDWSEEPARAALGKSAPEKPAEKAPAPAPEPPPPATKADPEVSSTSPVEIPPKSMHVRMPVPVYQMLRDIKYHTNEDMNDVIARATERECRRILQEIAKKRGG